MYSKLEQKVFARVLEEGRNLITKELNMVNLMKKERTINEDETRVSGHLDSKDDYIRVLIHRIKQSHTWHTVFICLQTDTEEWQWPL